MIFHEDQVRGVDIVPIQKLFYFLGLIVAVNAQCFSHVVLQIRS
jgi:hypothetical protein